jgi:type II secretory pathway pseudopilin PulG
LIELGIVIAVIAVLAAVVTFGRGFIAASRVSKAVEGMATIRKAGATYAGLQGGTFAKASTQSEVAKLQARSLIPKLATDAANEWTISGSGTSAFKVTGVWFDQLQTGTAVAIVVSAPEQVGAEDLFNSVGVDPTFLSSGAVAGQTCASSAPSGTTVILCFRL